MRIGATIRRMPLSAFVMVAVMVPNGFGTGCVPDEGVTGVGLTERATIAAGIPPPQSFCEWDCGPASVGNYESSDGGFTWVPKRIASHEVEWGSESVLTLQAEYTVQNTEVMVRTPTAENETAYSAEFLSNDANKWIQAEATSHLGTRTLATGPSTSIVYHQASGNLVVAMGLEGVVVGSPDGKWSRVAVGPYMPTDYSFAGKLLQVLSSDLLWATAISLSVCVAAIVSALRLQGEVWGGAVVAGILAPLVLAVLLALLMYPVLEFFSPGVLSWYLFGFVPVSLMACVVGEVVIGLRTQENRVKKSLALALALLSTLASAFLPFLLANVDATTREPFLDPALFLGIPALVFGFACAAIAWPQLRRRPLIGVAVAGMIPCFSFSFLAGILWNVNPSLACLFALALVLSLAILLSRYMRLTPKVQPEG